MSVAILTPAYNRAKTLPRLYNSLLSQTNKNFVWYVVDDGSQDNTEQVIQNFILENKIKIQYIKKINGGKHTALNKGLEHIIENLTFIVDSDDFLTNTAIETIYQDCDLIYKNNLCGISYLKIKEDGSNTGKIFPENYAIDTFINMRYNKNTYGDKAEVFVTEILKANPFPVFENEKFLSESSVWCKISGNYTMLFINKPIYICEYLDNGLSSNIHKTLFKNPIGSSYCYKILSGKEFRVSKKLKHTLLYICYSFAAKYKTAQILKNSNNKFLTFCMLPLGYILYLYKNKKYKECIK